MIPAVVGSIIVVGEPTHSAFLHFIYDLKVAQMNLKCSIIWEFMLYEFELPWKQPKTFVMQNSDGAVDHSTVFTV